MDDDAREIDETKQFLVTYNALQGRRFEPLGRTDLPEVQRHCEAAFGRIGRHAP